MAALLATLALFVSPDAEAQRYSDYRLELWVRPVGDGALIQKLGRATVTVYPQGVTADSLWLDGYTGRGSRALTLFDPKTRLYTRLDIDDFSTVIRRMSGQDAELKPGLGSLRVATTVDGKIDRHPARRHRIILAKDQWIDVWTSLAIPENQQLRRLTGEILEALSVELPPILEQIRGNPILVRLHTEKYRDVDILGYSSMRRSSAGHEDDLKLGRFYVRAPFAEKLWE